MTDKVQKIKEWISKTQDGLMNAQGNFEYPEHEGAYNILCNLDAYIDSLQEEPIELKDVDLEKELDKEWNKCEPVDEGMGLEIASIEHEQFDNIAKYFFELGIKAKGE